MIALARPITRGLARFGKARGGLAAVEFAMLLPIMMTLYLGCVEITTAVATQRKVTLTGGYNLLAATAVFKNEPYAAS